VNGHPVALDPVELDARAADVAFFDTDRAERDRAICSPISPGVQRPLPPRTSSPTAAGRFATGRPAATGANTKAAAGAGTAAAA
jgi:hypothetical protein